LGLDSYIFHISIGFTYGYLCLTLLGLLEIVVEVSTPKGLKIATDEIGGT